MGYFNWIPGNFVDNLQLDIVGFLAILGEGSVVSNIQVSTLSRLIFVPRLIPAPQVFLRPTRDDKLEPCLGNVTGVYSGNDKDFINYIGHVVLDAEDMPEYSVRCVQIIREGDNKVKARTRGPLSLLVLLGFGESIGILVVAIVKRDGLALLAVILLSFLSSLVGLANHWYLQLPKRREPPKRKQKGKIVVGVPTKPPPGDVVVRYPKGSFLVVECEENVARELYFAPENIYYAVRSPWVYRLMSLAGTMMLMLGIVTLGNAGSVPQLVFAGAYMVLNAAYWIVAALPRRSHWDLSAFQIRKQRFRHTAPYDDDTDFEFEEGESEKARQKVLHERKKMRTEAERTSTDLNPGFAWAMWKAIVATKSIEWVKKNGALPETPVWNEWLKDALTQARTGEVSKEQMEGIPYPVKVFNVPDWDPLTHFYDLLNKHKAQGERVLQEQSDEVPSAPGRAPTWK